MLVARWQIDARFGQRQTVIDMFRRWEREVGSKASAGKMESRILTGSIGAREATVEINYTIENLADLERFFDAIGKSEAHKQWGKDLEPHVVSGSSVWNIYRVE
jgi:hypothetical protein